MMVILNSVWIMMSIVDNKRRYTLSPHLIMSKLCHHSTFQAETCRTHSGEKKILSKHVETFIPIYTVFSQMPIVSGTKTELNEMTNFLQASYTCGKFPSHFTLKRSLCPYSKEKLPFPHGIENLYKEKSSKQKRYNGLRMDKMSFAIHA